MSVAAPVVEGSLGLFGRGRLGRALAASAVGREIGLAWQVGSGESPGGGASVVIDASLGEAVPGHLEWAARQGVPMVIAATGWQPGRWIEKAGERIGVLLAPNGSLTVALLARWARMLGAYAAQVPGAGLYVFDHHHGAKRDAPSGTARQLQEALENGFLQARPNLTTPEVSTAAIRAGYEVGFHRLGLDTPGETLEISHRARSREAFAHGLLTAALWLRGRTGIFTMDHVAADVLDPLFLKPSPNPNAFLDFADSAAGRPDLVSNPGERS